ncbi:MAG TPA: CotH kinase family protein, partial [Polyangiales bacterium]|nr:CotH kinase family protein [Polyangiales bacterium]
IEPNADAGGAIPPATAGSWNPAAGAGGMRPTAGAGSPNPTAGVGGAAPSGGAGGTNPDPTDAGTDAAVPDPPPASPLCLIALSCEGEIPDEPKFDCGLEITSVDGVVYTGRAGIERRGRSSQAYDKPNYGLELRDAAGNEQPTNLLGMGGEADWILDGSWVDRSFLRNELAFAMFRATAPDRWAPEGRFCELTLNGEARGIYRLGEGIKRDDDRIDIPEDDGSGQSFVVKQDSEGTLHWDVGEEASWALVSPKQEHASEAQRLAAQAFLDSLDQALQSRDEQATFALLDLDAVVDFVIVQELAKSTDAYNLSLHMWKAPGAPAQLVPWDFDLSMGQPFSEIRPGTDLSNGWVMHRTLLSDALERQPMFQSRLVERWHMHRDGALSDAAITAMIDHTLEILEPEAMASNFMIWPLANVDFQQIFPAYTLYRVSSYAEEIAHVRGWLMERTAWMDANIGSYPD